MSSREGFGETGHRCDHRGFTLVALVALVDGSTAVTEPPGRRTIALTEWLAMSKTFIIDRIRDVNHTVSRDWLESFSDTKLRDYLDHLELLQQPRIHGRAWLRRADVPTAIEHAPE